MRFEGARRFALYGAVSFAALAIDLTLVRMSLGFRLAPALAVSIGFYAATTFQFFCYRHIIFPGNRGFAADLARYIIAVILSWLAAVGMVQGLIDYGKVAPFVAKIISVPLLFPFNYLLNRRFAFRGR